MAPAQPAVADGDDAKKRRRAARRRKARGMAGAIWAAYELEAWEPSADAVAAAARGEAWATVGADVDPAPVNLREAVDASLPLRGERLCEAMQRHQKKGRSRNTHRAPAPASYAGPRGPLHDSVAEIGAADAPPPPERLIAASYDLARTLEVMRQADRHHIVTLIASLRARLDAFNDAEELATWLREEHRDSYTAMESADSLLGMHEELRGVLAALEQTTLALEGSH
jgi:hypothetical protein